MADLTIFEDALAPDPGSGSYYAAKRANRNAARQKLAKALDDADVALREASAMREQMTTQARHVAELEFEVARLTRQVQMIRLSSEPERFAWDDPRSHRECSHGDSIAAYRKCLAENMAAATPTEEN